MLSVVAKLLLGDLLYSTEISCQSVVYLNQHVFHWPTESHQLSDSSLVISFPRSCLWATERRVALTWVEGSDSMAVLYMHCCSRAVRLFLLHPAAFSGRAVRCAVRFYWARMCNNKKQNKLENAEPRKILVISSWPERSQTFHGCCSRFKTRDWRPQRPENTMLPSVNCVCVLHI